jgi:hypothetical protein
MSWVICWIKITGINTLTFGERIAINLSKDFQHKKDSQILCLPESFLKNCNISNTLRVPFLFYKVKVNKRIPQINLLAQPESYWW